MLIEIPPNSTPVLDFKSTIPGVPDGPVQYLCHYQRWYGVTRKDGKLYASPPGSRRATAVKLAHDANMYEVTGWSLRD